jgi:hypothetical protein
MTAKSNCDVRIDLLLRLLHPYASGVKRNPVIRSLTAESTNTAAKPALQQMAQDHLTLLPLYASGAKQNPVIRSPTAESTSTAAHPARRQLALSWRKTPAKSHLSTYALSADSAPNIQARISAGKPARKGTPTRARANRPQHHPLNQDQMPRMYARFAPIPRHRTVSIAALLAPTVMAQSPTAAKICSLVPFFAHFVPHIQPTQTRHIAPKDVTSSTIATNPKSLALRTAHPSPHLNPPKARTLRLKAYLPATHAMPHPNRFSPKHPSLPRSPLM